MDAAAKYPLQLKPSFPMSISQKKAKKNPDFHRDISIMKEKRLVYLNINCVQAFFAILDIIAYLIVFTDLIN